MGHYDSFYEREQKRYLKEREEQQSSCKHYFVPLRCNEEGKIIQIICNKCKKVGKC